MSPSRVLLVDANDDFLDGLAAWLEASAGLEEIGRAHSGHEAIEKIGRLRPDLVLMDVSLPDLSGFEVTRRVKAGAGAPRIVLLAFHGSKAVRGEALAAGADECVSKTRATEWLESTLQPPFRSPSSGVVGQKGSPRLTRPKNLLLREGGGAGDREPPMRRRRKET